MLPPGPDDWFGEVTEDDWAGRGAAAPAGVDPGPDRRADASARGVAQVSGRGPTDAAATRRAAVDRRRAVAVVALVGAAALGVGAALLVVRGGSDESASTVEAVDTTPTTAPTTTTPAATAPTDTTTAPAETTPTDTTATPTTPTDPGTSSFVLPEGTKLRAGEDADPAVVTSLQRALQSAGYDPGPIDGTYGPKTVAAVVAFQQANDLDDDGVVGVATAAALNAALAAG